MVLFGFTVALFLSCGSREDSPKTPSVPQKVRVERVLTSPVEEAYEAVGTVRSKTISILSSKVLGRIVSILVEKGTG